MICTIFGSNSARVLLNHSNSFPESKNIDTKRKWQAPPMVVEAEFHENHYSESESDSEISDNEGADEDLEDSQITNLINAASIFFSYTNQISY